MVTLSTWNITTLKALHTKLQDPVLLACVLGHQNWNNNSILKGSVHLVWKIQTFSFSLYKGLPSSRSHKLARTIIPTHLKILFSYIMHEPKYHSPIRKCLLNNNNNLFQFSKCKLMNKISVCQSWDIYKRVIIR